VVENGVVTKVFIDGTGKGADQVELYSSGQRSALLADTNGDRKIDVVQTFAASGELARQDEDSDFDGVIDRSFAGGKPVDPPAQARVPAEKLGPLDCGRFSDFWRGR
jgi:hypothetical protein